jgi:hypothetical protein
LFICDIPSSNIIIIHANRGQLFLIGEIILESPSKLIEIWWPIIINISKRCCHFKFLVSNKYFFKANNCGNKIFPIDNRFCDLYIKNILNRRSKFSSKIIKALFFCIYRKMIFQLIKIISELYHVLIKPLARIRISLLIFHLKIEITIENILKIRYIKFPINDNILPIIYFFFIFLYIGRNFVEINYFVPPSLFKKCDWAVETNRI